MSPLPPDPVARDFDYATTSDVCARARHHDGERWLWQGYLAAGHVTLLVGQWKAGKTTLLSVLLARLATGGSLAGLPVRTGRAVVVTEEDDDLWAERIEGLGLGNQLHLMSRPFRGRPTADQWQQLIDSLVARHAAIGFDLLVIDPLAAFLPGRTENNAGIMLDVLLPLQALTRRGAGVLVAHHPRKGATVAGQAARGSGALPGSVDILLELGLMAGAHEDDRRRRLSAFSRHRTTPRRLVIELNPEGTDYAARGDYLGHEFEDNWAVLSGVLEDAKGKLTRAEILAQWPADYAKPSAVMLWRWLDRALKEGLLLCTGSGRKANPFRYWLDGMEEVWRSDPLYLPPLPPLDPTLYSPQKTRAQVLAERAKKTGHGGSEGAGL